MFNDEELQEKQEDLMENFPDNKKLQINCLINYYKTNKKERLKILFNKIMLKIDQFDYYHKVNILLIGRLIQNDHPILNSLEEKLLNSCDYI